MRIPFFLLLTLLSITSCMDSDFIKGECSTMPSFEAPLFIEMEQNSLSIDQAKLYVDHDNQTTFMNSYVENSEMEAVAERLSEVAGGSMDNISAISIIVPSGYFYHQLEKKISRKDILGYVVYTFNQELKNYTFSAYPARGYDREATCSTSVRTKKIVVNHIEEVANCLTGGQGADMVLLFNKKGKKQRLEAATHNLGKPNHTNLNLINLDKVPDRELVCSKPCGAQAKDYECEAQENEDGGSEPNYVCVRDLCMAETSANLAGYFASASEKSSYLSQLRDFRNNFLVDSKKNYVSKYYELSNDLNVGGLSYSTLYDLLSVTPALLPKLEKLVSYKSGNTTAGYEVLYEHDFSVELVELIDRIVAEATLSEASLATLSEVKEDILANENKTVSRISAAVTF